VKELDMLNSKQKELLNSVAPHFSEAQFLNIVDAIAAFNSLEKETQLNFLKAANAMYRAGDQYIDDLNYDTAQKVFAELYPDHEFVNQIEPEIVGDGKTIPLPVRMLSTDKAYSKEEIIKWLERIQKAAQELDIQAQDIIIRVTPKLDGYAAYDDGNVLYTRGDGVKGRDISIVFARGLKVGGRGLRGLGQGEIVISKSYFEEKLSAHFDNSRNMQASIIAEKNVDERVQQAINDGAALFFPFSELSNWEGHIDDFIDNFDAITKDIWQSSDYDVDGVVIETTNVAIKTHMGFTKHHYRWQIAFKANTEKADVLVNKVTPQTSRTGRITPVVELEPTRLSGALISRATAHHYGMVKSKGIGSGALIELVRSGLVIPKIERVIKSAEAEIPDACPSCGSHVVWDGDNIVCPNATDCPAQAENTIIHFFKTLANIDGFGPATISILYENGIKTIHDVYLLIAQPEKLAACGFKEKTINNLVSQLKLSQTIAIEDWRFLAAFGVVRLGLASAESLLHHHPIEDIFELTEAQICLIDGFAEKTATAIVEGLNSIKTEFNAMFNLGFNLTRTALLGSEESATESSIAGKIVVFTGSMQRGSRTDMEKEAKLLGAKVASSVSGKTNYLVTGDSVGAKKIADAQAKGVTVITEDEYFALLGK
jgi:DNA ligase (NAD+)